MTESIMIRLLVNWMRWSLCGTIPWKWKQCSNDTLKGGSVVAQALLSLSSASVPGPSARTLDDVFAEAYSPNPVAGLFRERLLGARDCSVGLVANLEEEQVNMGQLQANVAELVRRLVAMEEALRTVRNA